MATAYDNYIPTGDERLTVQTPTASFDVALKQIGSPPVKSVATDAAKLALPRSTPVNSIWTVDEEGGRVEIFAGGDITSNANWKVLINTINLTVFNQCANTPWTLNEVEVFSHAQTNLGWVFPTNLAITGGVNPNSAFCVSFYTYNNVTAGGYTLSAVIYGNDNPSATFTSEVEAFSVGQIALPVNFCDRCSDALIIITDADQNIFNF